VDLDPEGLRAADRWSAPEDSFLWTEEHLRNLQAFASLPAECREILRLVGVEGVSYREIAGRLGITEGALKSRIHRCRLACREAAAAQRRPADREKDGR
jgi:RNA polymerase sigma-70 factor (ECF subfamily)